MQDVRAVEDASRPRGRRYATTRFARRSGVQNSSRLARAATPVRRKVGLALQRSRRARPPSPPRAGDPRRRRRGYYDAWARTRTIQTCPRRLTPRREVGDGPVTALENEPVWCQPWTILLTGSAVVYAPTLVFHAKWASALVAARPSSRAWFPSPRARRPEAVRRLRGDREAVLRRAMLVTLYLPTAGGVVSRVQRWEITAREVSPVVAGRVAADASREVVAHSSPDETVVYLCMRE